MSSLRLGKIAKYRRGLIPLAWPWMVGTQDKPESTSELSSVEDASSAEEGSSADELTVAIIVCVYTADRLDDIHAALLSLQEQTRRPDEVLVVVDYNPELLETLLESVDNTQSASADSMFTDTMPIRVISNTDVKGLSGGRNTGAAQATADVIGYLDDDATAEPRWLEVMMRHFGDDEVVAVSGWTVPNFDSAPPSWFPHEFLWVVGCSYNGMPTELAEVRNIFGGNAVLRRQTVVDAGGFDTRLGRTAERPLGGEETELCIRISQAIPEAKILSEPEAKIHHRVPADRTTWKYFLSRCRAEGNSKAYLTTQVGSDDGLGAERAYTMSVLPRAFFRALGSMPRQPVGGIGRAVALVLGLGVTGGGFVETKIRRLGGNSG